MLWPVEWTTTYGKGRVYVSTYGHVWRRRYKSAINALFAAVQTIIPRAVQWLAKRPVDDPRAEGAFSGDQFNLRPLTYPFSKFKSGPSQGPGLDGGHEF